MTFTATDDGHSVYQLIQGSGPVLFSVPHAGTHCPRWLSDRFTEEALALPDTDWFVDRLFGFAPGRGQSMLVANNTRYLVDLNRPVSNESLYPGQATTGLCPTEQFDGAPIYRTVVGIDQAPDSDEVAARVERYWKPYHVALEQELERLRSLHGYAVLFDCHSIASRVPRLFEGTLPVLNLGTNHGTTAAAGLESAVTRVLDGSDYAVAVNGRFVGGTITRTYGKPGNQVHALQLEIGWDGYLANGEPVPGSTAVWDEAKARALMAVLEQVAEVLERWRPVA